jgi:hypothetical protein
MQYAPTYSRSTVGREILMEGRKATMKVTAIETAVLHVPCPRPMSLEFEDHRMVAAFIDTDEGVRGFGYSLAFGGGGAEAIQVYLETRLKPLLVGEDPRMVGKLWEKMFRADRGIRRVGLAGYAVAALDIALWDLAGKVAGQPLFRMWGAVRDRVEAYGSGGWANYALDDIIAEGRFYTGHGCRYYKMKIHDPDPRKNVARVEAVKKALGDGVRMMVDVNQDAGRHGRESLHALRVQGTVRAARRALSHARRLPGQRVQRDAEDRPPRRRSRPDGLTARRARDLAARRRRAAQRVPGRVHELGARRSLRRSPEVRERLVPGARAPGPRPGADPGRTQEVQGPLR